MSKWNPFGIPDTFPIFVDGKPEEDINPSTLDSTYCMVFMSSGSNILGVGECNLPWFRQYKFTVSLEESLDIIGRLNHLLTDPKQFHDLYVWVLSAPVEGISSYGDNCLTGVADELENFSVSEKYVQFGNKKLKLGKAKSLIWYNFCLCIIAPHLMSAAKKYGCSRGVFMVDRFGGNDKTNMDFMGQITLQSSMSDLWKRAFDDAGGSHVGYEFAAREDGSSIDDVMQFVLTDWLTQAAFAYHNPAENLDSDFRSQLKETIELLGRSNRLKYIHIKNEKMKWK